MRQVAYILRDHTHAWRSVRLDLAKTTKMAAALLSCAAGTHQSMEAAVWPRASIQGNELLTM